MSIQSDLEADASDVLQADSVAEGERVIPKRSGVFLLAAVSFLESALPLPILTDPFLAAAILVGRTSARTSVLVATVFSVLGGIFAYFMAALFLDTLLTWLSPELVQEFQHMLSDNNSGTFVITLLGAVTPIPYTIVAWVVEVLRGNIFLFITASFIGRGVRYSLVGYLVYRFGPLAKSYSKLSVGILSAGLILLAGVYFLVKM
jgi:membrane protein YqaA with SNARE-associated domain